MPRITESIPDPLFEKLRVRKDQDGFGDKAWTEWFRFLTRDVFLEKTLSNLISDTTRDGLARLWMTNLAQNMPVILAGKKLWQLPKLKKPALIVGAGPSVEAKGHLNQLADWLQHHCLPHTPPPEAYPISIFATDRMLVPCLKHGISPEYVVSVDGNTEKIVKWYDDPIVEKYSSEIRGAVLAVTVAPNVVEKVRQAGITPYFFVAMLDQFHLTNNITRLMHFMTDCTAVNCFLPGTVVWAPEIPIRIQDIPPGKTVYAADTFPYLAQPLRRHYSGQLVRLSIQSHTDLILTPEHPLLTIKRDWAWRELFHRKKDFSPFWMSAKELVPGDILLSPIIKEPRARGLRFNGGYLPLTDELLWFLGLYAADGSPMSSRTANIALAASDSEGIERTRTILSDAFKINSRVREYHSCARIDFYSKALTQKLLEWCGRGSDQKHLPAFATGEPSALEGVFHGDGSQQLRTRYKGHAQVENKISTVSPILANQLFQTLTTQREYPRIACVAKRRAFPNAKPLFEIRWVPDPKWTWTRFWKNYYLMPVKTVSTEHYEGSVYNLSVAGPESYLADGIISHNCGGNAGSSSWALATYLGAKKIALIGLDYGYLKGTPIEETAYYNTLKQNNADLSQLFGLYFDYYNPEFQVQCYSDIMFAHYKEAFTAMLELADTIGPVETINCTEGGILNGGRFKCAKFADFLGSLDAA